MIQFSGCHLVAGEWTETDSRFLSEPAHGPAHLVCEADAAMVDRACQAAEATFADLPEISRPERADLLDAIAEELTVAAEAIIAIATRESGLTEARITGELGRTTGQLRLFSAVVRLGEHLEIRHDVALPDRQPAPRPDLYLVQRPLGPVAVFGASNFPLAFSVAGGDTASALAAGCPVVVKGNPAHPGTSETVAMAIARAIARVGLPAGLFALLQSRNTAAGAALVCHPLIRAVGFTGGLRGGRALFDLCAQRPEPIPFFGELGSLNPVFILPHALDRRPQGLAQEWVASQTLGVGQFCTKPGLVVLPAGPQAEAFVNAADQVLSAMLPQTMLSPAITAAYGTGIAAHATLARTIRAGHAQDRQASPALFCCDAQTYLANPALAHEVFGPCGLVVTTTSDSERQMVARALEGQLTATLHLDDGDLPEARPLLRLLERKAGRVLVNGWPTGVEVCAAMVHSGPYPASTNFGATSVGTLAIRRWLRPVCYQNLPAALLHPDLTG